MNYKRLQIFCIVNFLCLVAFSGFFFFKITNIQKIKVADSARLFEEFVMSKEIKNSGQKEFQHRMQQVQKLEQDIQIENNEVVKKELLQELISKREELQDFNQKFMMEESAKVLSRIESYAKDFAAERGYEIILSSGTNAGAIYASEESDITADLLQYINKRYEGFK